MFFKFPFTSRIWKVIIALNLVFNIPDDWSLILTWGIQNLKGRNFRASLCKVAWWATVYHIWIQRDVKAKMDSTTVNNSILNRILCNNWKLHLCNI